MLDGAVYYTERRTLWRSRLIWWPNRRPWRWTRAKVIEEAHREIEARFPSKGVRERLLARRDSKTPT
jgi:hypothetical protein